eukprot:CAMPEP_0202421880 /NCGR_PEP_ID=MMETSP1128-20130828/50569_1 /ASSEMBLY_ACC=CAM_ASM_000463 /TAXON_ID=3047 /ORGANISM="Dunaliella tertiolecta, Strain CCMP1320" /LENGTH=211 /DNA_ID=CAMNT_0049029923 /DNA_START=1331 /DNA_END=1967 /DNA_ORIENTATION=-
MRAACTPGAAAAGAEDGPASDPDLTRSAIAAISSLSFKDSEFSFSAAHSEPPAPGNSLPGPPAPFLLRFPGVRRAAAWAPEGGGESPPWAAPGWRCWCCCERVALVVDAALLGQARLKWHIAGSCPWLGPAADPAVCALLAAAAAAPVPALTLCVASLLPAFAACCAAAAAAAAATVFLMLVAWILRVLRGGSMWHEHGRSDHDAVILLKT